MRDKKREPAAIFSIRNVDGVNNCLPYIPLQQSFNLAWLPQRTGGPQLGIDVTTSILENVFV